MRLPIIEEKGYKMIESSVEFNCLIIFNKKALKIDTGRNKYN